MKILHLPYRTIKIGEKSVFKVLSDIVHDYPKKPSGHAYAEQDYMLDVEEVNTGETVRIILGNILANIMRTAAAEGSLVGRTFAIERLEPQKGKLYASYRVAEITGGLNGN